jgi:hypothetical protein
VLRGCTGNSWARRFSQRLPHEPGCSGKNAHSNRHQREQADARFPGVVQAHKTRGREDPNIDRDQARPRCEGLTQGRRIAAQKTKTKRTCPIPIVSRLAAIDPICASPTLPSTVCRDRQKDCPLGSSQPQTVVRITWRVAGPPHRYVRSKHSSVASFSLNFEARGPTRRSSPGQADLRQCSSDGKDPAPRWNSWQGTSIALLRTAIE